MNDGVSDFIDNRHPEARRFMIISLPGLFEAIVRSRMPKAEVFQHWLYFVVLPTLYHNPQLVKQIDDLKFKLQSSNRMGTTYQQESYRLRRNYNNLANKHNELVNNYNTMQTINGSIGRKYYQLKEDYANLQNAYDELANGTDYISKDENYVYNLSV